MQRATFFMAVLIAACGPSSPGKAGDGGAGTGGDGGSSAIDGGGGSRADALPTGPVATVRGTIWAPGNAPGMVPAGQEIPIHNAVIYLATTRPAAIPQETYCERCVDTQGAGVLSAHDGTFTIDRILPSTYWLIIQKGQFRIERQVTLAGDQTLELSAAESTLPSAHDPANGKWIPKMAIAVGEFDKLEGIFGKLGIGSVDSDGGFVPGSQPAQLDIWSNGGPYTGVTKGGLTALVSDVNLMLQYHIILLPCARADHVPALQNPQTLKNIREYVDRGGKLFVTDWSGEWMDNVFPAQITLGDSNTSTKIDTPAAAYDPATVTWNTALFGTADGGGFTSYNAEASDPDLFTWLDAQYGPVEESGNLADFDASKLTISGNYNYVTELTSVEIGADNEGIPVFDRPKAWVVGGGYNNDLTKRPMTVTFEPTGCGRVLFSTYHTTASLHQGLVPQERVLVYLLMEIGVCSNTPVID